MDDYISRKAAVDWFISFLHMGEDSIPAKIVIYDLKYAIPGADIATVRRGRWENHEDNSCLYVVKCSECGSEWLFDYECDVSKIYRYCPDCGARMEADNDTD